MTARRASLPLVLALACLPGLAAGGCGGSPAAAPTPGASAPASSTASGSSTGWRGKAALGSAVATDFALHDQNGRLVQLSAERGKLVLLTFLYTQCPDVCPVIAANLNQALRELGPRRSAVRVLAVSVDPVHDTPAAVRRYVSAHGLLPQFHYLIGSAGELKPVWQAYNLLVEVRSPERISHSAYVLLLDRRGRPRLYYPTTLSASDVEHDLGRLLRRD